MKWFIIKHIFISLIDKNDFFFLTIPACRNTHQLPPMSVPQIFQIKNLLIKKKIPINLSYFVINWMKKHEFSDHVILSIQNFYDTNSKNFDYLCNLHPLWMDFAKINSSYYSNFNKEIYINTNTKNKKG